MLESASNNANSLDRRNVLKGLAGLSAYLVAENLGFVEEASAQEATPERPYEKQEQKIPSVEKLDKLVREFAEEKGPDGLSLSITVLEDRIFGGDASAGVKAFEYTNGIGPNLQLMRSRAEKRGRETQTIDEIYAKALALRNAANSAYIDFLQEIPNYTSVIRAGLKTDGNAESMHGNALTIAKANDALIKVRDEVRRIMGQ